MDCSNCLILKKQFEDLKQKHLVDFRTIKQKIISTDTLIRSYQEKCQESDKQKKYAVELTSKLDGAQRSVEVIKLQLKKSLEHKEPLQQKCNELERERAHQCAELESLQDRVKGFENLVSQLQSVIKENEKSRNSVDLEASLHKDEIEELKKNQKKNEAQMSKLSDRLQAEKNSNKALNKELTKSQNQVKTLLEEKEESKKLIMKLQKQVDAGRRQNEHCEKERNVLLDKQMLLIEEYQKTIKRLKEEVRLKAKQENSDEDKNPSGYKIKSPITPKKSPRKWNDVTPKQEESSAIFEQTRPLTRLQQKNLIVEIEKKSLLLQVESPENISPTHHKNEEESEIETLLDIVNEMLDAPYCPPLSPLPPSPFFDHNSVGEFENDDSGYTCGENTSDWNTVGINNDLENYTGDEDGPVDIDSKTHCDDINDDICEIDDKKDRDSIETEDLEKPKGKKRELEEFCGTPMSLRSGKKRKNGNSENEVSRVYTLRRTKSVDMTSERNTTDESVPVTRSKSVEETIEGVLEVKPRRRRSKRKLSSNDGDHEQSFESSDNSTVETNAVDTSKQSLDTSNAQNNVLDLRKQASDIAILEDNILDSVKQPSDIFTAESNVLNSRIQTSDDAISEKNVVGLSEQSSDNTAKNDVRDSSKESSDIAISENRKEFPDTAILDNNVLDSIKQSSDTTTAKNNDHHSRKESTGIAILESNVLDSIKQSSDISTAQKKVLDSRKQASDVVIAEKDVAVLSKQSSDTSTAKNIVLDLKKPTSDIAILGNNVLDTIKQSSDMSTAQKNVLDSRKQPPDIAISENNVLDFTKQSSDTSNVLELRKQTTDIAIVENIVVDTTKQPSDNKTVENNVVGSNKQSSDIAIAKNNVIDSREQSSESVTVQNNVVVSNEQYSDTSTAENNVLDSGKQWTCTAIAKNNNVESIKQSSDSARVENNAVGSIKQSSDTSTAENNVLDSRKQSSDTAVAKNSAMDTSKHSSDSATVVSIVDTTKHSDGGCEEDNNKKIYEKNIFQETPRRPRTRSMDKLDEEGVVNDKVCCKKETSATRQTNSSNQNADLVLQTSPLDELVRPGIVTEEQQTERKFKVPAPENENNIETTSSLIRGQTWPTDELCVQDEGARSKVQDSSDRELPSTRNKLENKCSENIAILKENVAERNYRERNDVLRDIIDTVANATTTSNNALSISKERTSTTKDQVKTKDCIDSQDTEVMECLYDVADSVVLSNHITPHEKWDKPLSPTTLNSKVVHGISKASSTSIGKTNDIEDNHDNVKNSSTRATKKAMQDNFDSSKCLELFSTTSIGKTKRKAMSVTVHEYELCDSFVDKKVEHEAAELKESSVSLKDQLKPISTSLSPISITPKKSELIKPKSHSQKTQYMNKNETSSSKIESDKSTEGSTIPRGVITPTKLPQESSVSLKEQLEPVSILLSPIPITPKKSEVEEPRNYTPRTQYMTENETSSSKIESGKSTEGSTISNGVKTPKKLPQDSSVCLEEQLEPISSLSPIHATPKKSGGSVRIPCFDSLDQLPLSPIPPSPPSTISSPPPAIPSPPPSQGVEAEESFSINLTKTENMAESGEEIKVGKKRNILRNQLPTNALLRYPGVNEIQFTVFIFTKLKNREISLEDLITAFSVRKNIRNHTPIANGLVSVLKSTQEGDEHVLMEEFAERYNHESEGTGRPIVSDFEMQVLIAVNRLSNLQRHANLLNRLIKLLGMNLCQLFTSEKNDTGILAICRIFTGVCRLIGEGSRVLVLCYDILKQNKRYALTEKVILSIAFVWPGVLGKGLNCVTLHTESVTIAGYRSFLATLEIILMSREVSCEQSRQCLQRICGWCDACSDKNVLEWLATDLVRVLRVTSEATFRGSSESNSISNAVFETIKSLELLAIIMGWKWTNDILIREILWPVFKDWMVKGFDSKQEISLKSESKTSERMLNTNESARGSLEAGTMYIDELRSLESNAVASDCQAISTDSQTNSNFKHVGNYHDHNTDAIIKNILHLFGLLGFEVLQKGEMVNLDAVINLMSAIVSSPDCEKVSFSVQHSAADALLNLIIADPVKIIHVLEDWIKKCRKINDISTAEFERRMKNVRSNLWTT